MPNEVTCEKLREICAELALGVLPGRARAAAVAHLERCADCREQVRQLTWIGDRLIGLLPAGEPPVGFETRVAWALTRAAGQQAAESAARGGLPAADPPVGSPGTDTCLAAGGSGTGRPTGALAARQSTGDACDAPGASDEPGVPDPFERRGARTGHGGRGSSQAPPGSIGSTGPGDRRRPLTGPRVRRRRRRRLAAAATAIALAIGFGGWSVGTAVEGALAGPAASGAGQDSAMLWGGLTAIRGQAGKSAGEVYSHLGDPSWVYMSVDLAGAGDRHTGKVFCLLVRRDGSAVRVGSFSLHEGRGTWAAPLPSSVGDAALSGARLTASDGTPLAVTHFTSGRES
ncbi:hypothetical protein [Streptomyces sp. NPDC018610]|uniref:hypothetical protein n=1 Tax=Streptomyces sp. NPDC018610 TaxID=3365049 RepID=UPI0037BC290E